MIDTVAGYCALIDAWRAQSQPLYNQFIHFMIESGKYLVTTENGAQIPVKQAIEQINMKLEESHAGARQRNNRISLHSGITVLNSQADKLTEEVKN